MNEHDESEIAARLINSATKEYDAMDASLSRSKELRLVGVANEAVRPMTLPAGLAARYFLPHAREKGTFQFQHRRISDFSSQLTVENASPGPGGLLDHPTCCLHISSPCWPRHNYHETTRNNVGRIAGDGDGDVSALRVRNRNCAYALSPASSRAYIQKEVDYERGSAIRNETGR
jgi:hypothetical protein